MNREKYPMSDDDDGAKVQTRKQSKSSFYILTSWPWTWSTFECFLYGVSDVRGSYAFPLTE